MGRPSGSARSAYEVHVAVGSAARALCSQVQPRDAALPRRGSSGPGQVAIARSASRSARARISVLLNGGGHLDRLSLPTGRLVIFDRRPEAPPWQERGAFEDAVTPSGRPVTLLRV